MERSYGSAATRDITVRFELPKFVIFILLPVLPFDYLIVRPLDSVCSVLSTHARLAVAGFC